MIDNCVEPAISASVNTIINIAGSASEAIIISRLEPMPPNEVPTSRPASARKKRALPSKCDERNQVSRPGKQADRRGKLVPKRPRPKLPAKTM